MSESHRVILHNHSGDDGDYALFVALPHITCEDGGFMQTNVWVSRYVSDGGEQSIEVDDDIYAWYDVQKGPIGPGYLTVGGTYHRAILGAGGRRKGTTFHTAFRGGHGILVPAKTHNAPDDRFDIHAQEEPSRPELIGIAKRGDKGAIVPVIAMRATPGYSYSIKPVAKYYLARVDGVEVGESVELRSIRHKAVIDFSLDAAQGKSEVVITHNEDGKFQVQYRNPPPLTPPAAEPESPSFGMLRRKNDRWSGNITWPDTTSTATVVQASGMLIDSLSPKYNWSVNTSQTQNGGVSTKVHFWLCDDSRQPDYMYTDDWKAAVERSLGHDDHVDLGCSPYSAYSSFTRLALAMH
jgi:hypothetical protein